MKRWRLGWWFLPPVLTWQRRPFPTWCQLSTLTMASSVNKPLMIPATEAIMHPSASTTIRGYAFWNCRSLVRVTMPYTVTRIEIQAYSRTRNRTRYRGWWSTNDGIAYYSMRQSSCYWRMPSVLICNWLQKLLNSKTLMKWLLFSIFVGVTLLSLMTEAFLLWWYCGTVACLDILMPRIYGTCM